MANRNLFGLCRRCFHSEVLNVPHTTRPDTIWNGKWCFYRNRTRYTFVNSNATYLYSAGASQTRGRRDDAIRVRTKPPSLTQIVCEMEYRCSETQAKRTELAHVLGSNQSALPTRRLRDSYDEAIIPFKEDLVVREEYYNAYKRIRFGKLLEDLDTFAGSCSVLRRNRWNSFEC